MPSPKPPGPCYRTLTDKLRERFRHWNTGELALAPVMESLILNLYFVIVIFQPQIFRQNEFVIFADTETGRSLIAGKTFSIEKNK